MEPSYNDVSYIAELKKIMLEDMKKRFSDNMNFSVLFKSTFLDIRFKRLKVIKDVDRAFVHTAIKSELKSSKPSSDANKTQDNDNDENKTKRMKLCLNFDESDDEEDSDPDEDIEREFNNYLAEPEDRGADPLVWWKEHEAKYPNLSKLAKKYLAIPATSVEAERRFSDLGILLTKRRLNMTGAHVDAQLFLKDKLRK